MNAAAAAKLAKSKPLDPRIHKQVEIVHELIQMAAEDGKFFVEVSNLCKTSLQILETEGYNTYMCVNGRAFVISWESKIAGTASKHMRIQW